MFEYEWDYANMAHLALHFVAPSEAEEALNGPTLSSIPTRSTGKSVLKSLAGRELDESCDWFQRRARVG